MLALVYSHDYPMVAKVRCPIAAQLDRDAGADPPRDGTSLPLQVLNPFDRNAVAWTSHPTSILLPRRSRSRPASSLRTGPLLRSSPMRRVTSSLPSAWASSNPRPSGGRYVM